MAFNGMCARAKIAAVVAWFLAGYGMAFGEVVTWPAAPGPSCTNDYVLSVTGRNVNVMTVRCNNDDGIVRDETGSRRDNEAWRPHKTRIACIGDSITYGFGLKDRARDAYPAQLQRMLDEKFPGKYEVRNFGNPGRGVYTHTKFKGTCRAFVSVPEHALALAWHPDIVICNLGANDWGEIDKEGDGRLAKGTFAREYHALLDEYRNLSTKPKIVIWTALAPLGKAHGCCGKPCVETLNAELVRFAGEEGLPGIDMRTPLANDIESLVLKDGIHPDPEGSRRIAEATLKVLFK